MPQPVHVAQRPPRPLLIFDGDCNFCRFWVQRWQQITGDRVDFIPFQDPTIESRFPELARARFEAAVHLIEPDGSVYSGAEAALRALANNRYWRWPLAIYRTIPGARPVSEWAYQLVARNRTTFSFLTRLLWGQSLVLPQYQLVRWMFLRGLALIYLVAFISLWVQIEGLLGNHGVLPAKEYMESAERYFDQQQISVSRFYSLPTWCWIGTSDAFLHTLCAAGIVGSLLLLAGVAPALTTFLLWTLYLSLSVVGREFLAFQWDALLLETGFLAVLIAPLQIVSSRYRDPPVPRIAVGLLRWLLFRMMFESGCVKLLSGDPTWRNLTALSYHYETQPLPTWIAWYVHHMPASLHQACVGVLFGVELGLPFLIFGPRRLRVVAGLGLVSLQLWILLTGNYGFFNYLTILLCVLLLDDGMLKRVLPAKWKMSTPRAGRTWPRWLLAGLSAVILLITVEQLLAMFGWQARWLRPVRALAELLSPIRSINRYGLFAVMTTSRPEIIMEGSNDRKTWLAYEFRYKPGLLNTAPQFVAPHQPRLDWQMWFAALGTPQQNPWFINFSVRLLQGSPEVLRLLRTNPFPESPPRYIRAVVYQYHFAPPRLRRQQGLWWQRELMGTYLHPISLRNNTEQ